MSYIDNAKRKLVIEWPYKNGIAKILEISRNDIDDNSKEPNAYELIYIDNGGVRRHETFIDRAYSRFDGFSEEDVEILGTCPDQYIVNQL